MRIELLVGKLDILRVGTLGVEVVANLVYEWVAKKVFLRAEETVVQMDAYCAVASKDF